MLLVTCDNNSVVRYSDNNSVVRSNKGGVRNNWNRLVLQPKVRTLQGPRAAANEAKEKSAAQPQ